jgi:hypothetical protein
LKYAITCTAAWISSSRAPAARSAEASALVHVHGSRVTFAA